jgi:hypothetical protein
LALANVLDREVESDVRSEVIEFAGRPALAA